MRNLAAALIVLAGTCTLADPADAAFACPHLAEDARRAMTGWQVPGLAIGIVRDGATARRLTVGVRDAESGAPVTAKTMFGTGSLTKSLTALGAVLAARENLVGLDRPVRQVLPTFPTGVSLRHLLSHTAGWPRHDALWYLDRYSRTELAEKLSLLPRFALGGRSFQYNNVPFATAGVALERATGTPWHDWIRARILAPAGMMDAVTMLAGFRQNANRATGYFPADESRIALALRDTDPVAPAAGLYAHLDDMLRYLTLFATDGTIAGKRILPAAAFPILRTPITARYGLGLRLGSWNGQDLAFHPGFVDGYGARLSFLPASRSGVIVLSNMSGETPAAQIVSQTALDCLTDAPRTDWVARFGHRRAKAETISPRPPPQTTDRDAAAYTGTYDHAAYG
ncbi:MAG: serine hydrolase, partial [Proteobacteria bacterium]|nr:serine hydrolase [Pseudomonadota bacterium]